MAEPISAIVAVIEVIHIVKSISELFINENENVDNSLMASSIYDIHQGIRSMNTDLLTILNDIPEQTVLIQNMQSFEQKIQKIEDHYKDMVYYNRTYKNLKTAAKNDMIQVSYSTLKYSSDGPIELIHDAVELLAFGSINVLDKLKQKSLVRNFKLFTSKLILFPAFYLYSGGL